MTARRLDLNPHKRGDTIYIQISDVVDASGVAVTLADYSLRAVLKLITDTAANDSSALSSVTHSAGITVSGGNDMLVKFPASATVDVAVPTILKYEVQATKTADTTEVRTLAEGQIPLEADAVITSP